MHKIYLQLIVTEEEIEGISEHESELYLSNLQETQVYSCIARNDAGSSKPATTTVHIVEKGIPARDIYWHLHATILMVCKI